MSCILNSDNIFELVLIRQNKRFCAQDNLIMLTFDDNYVDQTINLILSVMKNHSKPISFYCVCLKLNEENVQKLLELEVGLQVRIYNFNYEVNTGHWPKTTLLRVFSPWLLDLCVEKILYLDSDILCSGSLTELFEMNVPYIAMGNEISGNVSNGNRKGKKSFIEEYPMQIYCNAGVVLINLKNIRSEYDFGKVFKNCCNICEEYYCNDQDFLNIFFIDKITYFNGLCFNFQAYELKGTVFYQYALMNCRLIHFSSEKPWKDTADREIMRIYLKYSLYLPIRKRVKQSYKHSLLKSPYRTLYKLLAKIKHKVFK